MICHNNAKHRFGLSFEHIRTIGYFLVFLTVAVVFTLNVRMIPFYWVFGGFGLAFAYFYAAYGFERRLGASPPRLSEGTLFRASLLVRLLALGGLLFVSEMTWGRMHYVGAVDALRYWRVSTEVSNLIWAGGFDRIYAHLMAEYGLVDNIGVPLFVGLLFAVTANSIIIAKLFFALMGSLSVVYIYRTAVLLCDAETARLAGILAAFMPLSLFYDIAFLKEGFVVFLTSVAIYLATKAIKTGRFTLVDLFALCGATGALFLFRTAAAAIVLGSLCVYFMVNRMRGNVAYSWFTGAIVVGVVAIVINTSGHGDYFVDRIEAGNDHGERRVAEVERGTAWKDVALGPVFVVLSHFAPFPSMVDLSPRWGHDATYYWIAGTTAWNILAYFALLGLWRMVRNRPRETLMVWGYTLGYTVVLGLTAMFTQVRLTWNVMPMMMIPAAIGLMQYRRLKYFHLYLIGAGLLIVAWNIFRAIGRGVL